MTQTRRHSYIVSLLGIKHVVVAINKMDLVDYAEDRFERDQARLLRLRGAKLGIPDVQFIPISALHGDNVVDKSGAHALVPGPAAPEHLETVPIASDGNLADLRFPVQYVLRPDLDFRGFAGTIASGVSAGATRSWSLPSGRHRRESSPSSPTTATWTRPSPAWPSPSPSQDEIDVSRGDMLVHPDAGPSSATRSRPWSSG